MDSSSRVVVPSVPLVSIEPGDVADVQALIDVVKRLPRFERYVVEYWARRYAGELPQQRRQLSGN